MPSRVVLLVFVLGVAVLGGSFALDATTPEMTYTYQAIELTEPYGRAIDSIAHTNHADPEVPSAVRIAHIHAGDRPERTALREAANGSYTVSGENASLPGVLTRTEYVIMTGPESGIPSEYEIYYVQRSENDGAVRLTADQLAIETFYARLAVPAEQDPRRQELVRTGTVTTHERLTAVLIEADGRYHYIHSRHHVPYRGLHDDLHNAGYLIGIQMTIFAGGWVLYRRWSSTPPGERHGS